MNDPYLALLWMTVMALAIIAIVGGGAMLAYFKGLQAGGQSKDQSPGPTGDTPETDRERDHSLSHAA